MEGAGERFWFVDFKKEGRRVCFKRGWEEFMNIHGLGDNKFLVFNYMGGINFNVVMFDKNGVGRCTFKDNQDNEPLEGGEDDEPVEQDEDDELMCCTITVRPGQSPVSSYLW